MRRGAIVVLTVALALGPGLASAAPTGTWPAFDQGRLQQIADVFAAHGITVCPDGVRPAGDVTGSSAQQTLVLFASTRWPECPQHRPTDDPRYNLEEERLTHEFEAFVNVDLYTSQNAFDRGIKKWSPQRLRWAIVGWSWKPVVIGLNAGYPDVVEAVLKAMKALPGRPDVLFDNS